MTIGIDAGALSISDERLQVGVYRVTVSFLKELVKIDQKALNSDKFVYAISGDDLVLMIRDRFIKECSFEIPRIVRHVYLPPRALITFLTSEFIS